MRTNLLVVDDFYPDPLAIREFALAQQFEVAGNFPGKRTKPYLSESVKENIEKILLNAAGKVEWATSALTYTGAFQYTTEEDSSWIHVDTYNTWAGVCYLTPDAPPSAGTGIFKHKETGFFQKPADEKLAEKLSSEGNDLSKWELIEVMSNNFNRMVMYRGDLYHRSLDYFGKNKETGRLFQTFFITTGH
jgi:hypothetical protein